jgi:NADH-quinone oxidoreductase subunit G
MTTTSDAAVEAPTTVSLTVDGRTIVAQPGELIIAAAERAGIFIPRFCYHPRMKPVGMCRMCLVEVSGPRGASLQPACFVAVAEGQEIHTGSPMARKAQDGVLEMLLVNHPLDCPVCDKGGECPLQDQTMSYGPGESRFLEEKRHFEKPIAISDLVHLDRERCIQCARCTRFAEEIAGEALIDFQGRGDRIEVNVFPGNPFNSYFSGNTVQICPVGALTATPYRFRARPWDLEQAETTCTTCAVGCRVAVQSSAGRLVRYLGIDADAVNQSWLCDKGRFGYEWIDGAERLGTPYLRRDGKLEPANWATALRTVANEIKDAKAAGGPERVAVIGGARLANEDAYAWAKLAKAVIGTDSVDAQLGDGLPAEVVLGLPRATIDEACAARAVVLLAPDLREEMPVLFLRLRHAAVEGKVPLVELAPVPTALARYAAASVSYRPGEAMIAAGALAGGPSGPSGPLSHTPTGGVEPDALAAAHAVLGTGDGEGIVIVLGRPSLAEAAEGVAAAAELLATAWPKAKFLPVLRRANVQGALDMGLAPGVLPGRVSLDDGRAWFAAEDAWGAAPAVRGRDTKAILEAAAAGEIDVLVLLGADPLSDFPDRDLARRALDRPGSVVAVATVLDASSERANVVLPAAAYGERAGTTTNCEGRVSRLAQKIVAPGVAWPDWMIASELADRLGGDLGFESLESIWEEIERLALSHRGVTRQVLLHPESRDGVVLPLAVVAVGAAGIAVRTKTLEPIDPIATPGILSVEVQGAPIRSGTSLLRGTVEDDSWTGANADLEDDGDEPGATSEDEGTDEDAAAGVPPAEAAAPPARPALLRLAPSGGHASTPVLDRYSFRLVARRHLYDAGTLVQACPSLAPLAATQRARANPAEVARLGVASGDLVRIRSPRASLVVRFDADAAVPSGVVWLGFNVMCGKDGDAGGGAADLMDTSAAVVDVRVETI